MTLQIRSIDTISGVSIVKVRDFFRHVVSWHRESFELSWLKEQLSLDSKSTNALAAELAKEGYIEDPRDGICKLTDKGDELVRASAAGEISRKTAEAALSGLLNRVEQYNADTKKILTIDSVVVFGSYLGAKEKLGDLDIAVKYRDRNPVDPDRAKTALAYAKRSGRHFSNFVELLSWPDTELFQILKARKRTIKIQDWNSFLRIVD